MQTNLTYTYTYTSFNVTKSYGYVSESTIWLACCWYLVEIWTDQKHVSTINCGQHSYIVYSHCDFKHLSGKCREKQSQWCGVILFWTILTRSCLKPAAVVFYFRVCHLQVREKTKLHSPKWVTHDSLQLILNEAAITSYAPRVYIYKMMTVGSISSSDLWLIGS